jgi:VCBS repeat-containing protein
MHAKALLPILGAAALALPGVALAGNGHGKALAKGHAKPSTSAHSNLAPAKGRGRNLVVKGTVKAVDTTAGTVTVTVTGANHAAKSLKGTDVVFDVSKASIRAADTNGNHVRNELADVKVGDKVLVHAHLAKGASTTQPIPARQLRDQTRSKH